ncbi:MAG: Smr/MutS family protein [Deltaproteobacteria bacterium]|nr:Smr/MutS family protein [Deltaproteobacteria bacterium]
MTGTGCDLEDLAEALRTKLDFVNEAAPQYPDGRWSTATHVKIENHRGDSSEKIVAIDLHKLPVRLARQVVEAVIWFHHFGHIQFETARFITGLGKHSDGNEPVLRPEIIRLLEDSEHVSTFRAEDDDGFAMGCVDVTLMHPPPQPPVPTEIPQPVVGHPLATPPAPPAPIILPLAIQGAVSNSAPIHHRPTNYPAPEAPPTKEAPTAWVAVLFVLLVVIAGLVGLRLERESSLDGGVPTADGPGPPPPPDQCLIQVATALQEVPECVELFRQRSHGTCVALPGYRERLESAQYRERVEGALAFCMFLWVETARGPSTP